MAVLTGTSSTSAAEAVLGGPHGGAYRPPSVGIRGAVSAAHGLAARGHEVRTLEAWTWRVGGVHAIAVDPDTGLLSAGADPRRDGQAVAF